MISNFQAQQTWKTEDQYIQKFAHFAVEEMEKYKIPASITLAQGLLETGGGQSILAQQGNNHFGIKCKENWTGKTMKYTDDAPNECFRVYDDPKQSYEDHSVFLVNRPFYRGLFDLDPKDYKAWAHGLKKAGYATNPRYAYILIDKIEKYKLYEFDNTSSKEVLYTVLKLYPDLNDDRSFMASLEPSKKKPEPKRETKPVVAVPPKAAASTYKSDKDALSSMLIKNHPNGAKKFVIVPARTNISFIAQKYGISEKKLLKWNDLTTTRLNSNDLVFLEPKSNSGNTATYKAESGDTMHSISQKFGIKLKTLYSRNRMAYGKQPKRGQLIYLQAKAPRS